MSAVAHKAEVEELQRRYGRRLLRIPGVSGVGIERGEGREEYVLVVHVSDDGEKTRAAVSKLIGDADAVRIVKSGPFKKQS